MKTLYSKHWDLVENNPMHVTGYAIHERVLRSGDAVMLMGKLNPEQLVLKCNLISGKKEHDLIEDLRNKPTKSITRFVDYRL